MKVNRPGERLEFYITIHSTASRNQKLVIDYVMHFARSNGTRARKVLKLKRLGLAPYGSLNIARSHHIKKITTREYYPGLHGLEVQINGKIFGREDWFLTL